MADDDIIALADRLQQLSGTEIDLVHEVLLRLTNEDNPRSPTSIQTTFERVSHERRRKLKENDDVLDFLLGLGGLKSSSALYADFQDVVDRAGIVLHIGSTTTASEASSVHDENRFEDELPTGLMQEMEMKAAAMDQRILVRDALQALSSTFATIRMERLADQFYLHSLKLRSLSHWLHTTRLQLTSQSQADVVSGHKLLRDVLVQWNEVLRWNKLQEQVEHNLKVKYFVKWVSTTRLHQYVRLRQENLLADTARKWFKMTRNQKDSESRMCESADQFRNQTGAKQTIETLLRKKRTIDDQNSQALLLYEPHLLRNALRKWIERTQEIRRINLRAEDANDYFTELNAFQKLKVEWLRRKTLRRKFVTKWRAVIEERKKNQYQEGYRRLRTMNKENIARAALKSWKAKSKTVATQTQAAIAFEEQQAEARTTRIAHNLVQRAYKRAHETVRSEVHAETFSDRQTLQSVNLLGKLAIRVTIIREHEAKADELNAIKESEITRNALRSLKRTAFNMRRREEDAEAFRHRSEKSNVSKFIHVWDRAVKIRRLKKEQEEEINNSHNDHDSGFGPSSGASSGRVGFSRPVVALTPAVRRSQLLSTSFAPQSVDGAWLGRMASTTPAYTPGKGLTSFNKRLREVMRSPGTPTTRIEVEDAEGYG